MVAKGRDARPDDVTGARDSPPADFVVTFDDYHPTWGGERITLRGDRTIEMRRWRPGDSEDAAREITGEVPAEALRQTIALLVELEAWEQRTEAEGNRLDDARARLRISVGDDRGAIWEWRNDLEATGRLVRIKQQLEALTFDLRHPLVDGADGPMDGDGPI